MAFLQTRKLNVACTQLLKQVAFCEDVHNYIKLGLKLLVNYKSGHKTEEGLDYCINIISY